MTADHTPSPATDGLREAIEALLRSPDGIREWRNQGRSGETPVVDVHRLRAVLAAHPAPPSETAPVLDGPSFGDYWPPSETTGQPRRDQAISVMAYLDGWLSGEWPEVARYLRDHATEIADHMVDDGCADDTPLSETSTEGSWLRDVYARAKARNAQIPPHAGMVVTSPDFGVPTERTHPAPPVSSDESVRRYLDRVESVTSSESVLSVIQEIRDELSASSDEETQP